MDSPRRSLLYTAIPAFAASFLVLAIAGVGKAVWLVQLVSVVLAMLLALFARLPRDSRKSGLGLYVVCAVTLAGLGAPLLGHGSMPERWLRIGPFSLYMAPLLLPAFLGAIAALGQHGRKGANLAVAALVVAGALLAAQPDAAQAAALLGGALILCLSGSVKGWRAGVAVLALSLASGLSMLARDPLEPVPYVEGVFALALQHSFVTGVAVIAAAAVLLVGLGGWSSRHARWVLAVSAYYGVLFAFSVRGATPAPLIGYGAGPLLGFGLMVAIAARRAFVQGSPRGPAT